MFLETPAPHAEAAKRIRDKSPVTRAQFDQLLPELKDAAFLITGVTCFDVLQRVQDLVAQLPEGGKFRALQQQIEDELEPYLGEGPASERRAQLLLRVHGFRAYAATNYKLMQAHKDAFPFRQYITSGDDRVRSSHAALAGKIFPADSPFWDNHTPPWNWGCRCEAIPLMQDEVDEMRGEDARLPPESRRVVEGLNLQRLEELGELITNNGVKVDVKTQRERTGDPSAFEWRPGEYGMPMAKIQARYDKETFDAWRKWAQSTTLPDGKRTVWQAFNKRSSAQPKPAPVQPAPAPAPAPAAPATTALIPQGGAPVSAILPNNLDTELKQAAAMIDMVHGDGKLRQSKTTMMPGSTGTYAPATGDITVGNAAQGRGLQLIHELGHKLDHEALPGALFTSNALFTDVMKPFLNAVKKSQAYRKLGEEPNVPTHYLKYCRSHVELWARAYAQFITEESGHPVFAEDLRRRLDGKTSYLRSSQWEPEDFAPIRAEIRKLFASMGWMTPAP